MHPYHLLGQLGHLGPKEERKRDEQAGRRATPALHNNNHFYDPAHKAKPAEKSREKEEATRVWLPRTGCPKRPLAGATGHPGA